MSSTQAAVANGFSDTAGWPSTSPNTASEQVQLLLNFLSSSTPESSSYNSETSSSIRERPAKRRKFGDPDIEHIDIHAVSATFELVGVRHADLPEQPLLRKGLQERLRMQMSPGAAAPGSTSLAVSTRRTKICDLFIHTAKLPDHFKLASDIAEATYLASEKDQKQGKLWAEMNWELYRGEKDDGAYLKIDLAIKWNITKDLRYVPQKNQRRLLLHRVMKDVLGVEYEHNKTYVWSAKHFYDSVHVPSKDDIEAHSVRITSLDTELFPFQQRTLKWLLQREGVRCNEHNTIELLPASEDSKTLPHSFTNIQDFTGKPAYFSSLLQVISRDASPYRQLELLKGGILCEEMGLGKTLEIIALIVVHRRDVEADSRQEIRDVYSQEVLRPIGTTLIITPPAILEQWITEINRHAPALKVMQYRGMTHHLKSQTSQELLDELASCDVVLSTYTVLAAEIWFTAPVPDRKTRYGAAQPRKKSPFMVLSWWRVCLDEAQMIDSGVSAAAKVASWIPRINSWGVSGTPVKKDVLDLYGLLCFLRLEPYSTLRYYWDKLCLHHEDEFTQLFGTIALRHSKYDVREEMRLPGQQRFVVTVPFTLIEEQYYRDLFTAMCRDVGVTSDGAPRTDDWDPEDPATIEKMRGWLVRLRQATLHPEIGHRNRRALGNRTGPLRTIDEVLDAMIDLKDTTVRGIKRSLLMAKLRSGQYLENSPRVKEALEIWTSCRVEASELVSDAREQLAEELAKVQAELDGKAVNGFKAKMQDGTSDSEDEDSSDGLEPGSELHKRIGVMRNRLRNTLEVEHMAVFFQANAYFQIKSNEEFTEKDSEDFKKLEKLESDGYDLSKQIRQEMLKEPLSRTTRLMRKLAKMSDSDNFASVPIIRQAAGAGENETNAVFRNLSLLIEGLNSQAAQLDVWRKETMKLLQRTLVDDEDNVEITGEEYDQSTKTQDEVFVFVTVLRTVIEDRFEILTGQDNILINNEMKLALRMAGTGSGPFPEKLISLAKTRDSIKPRVKDTMRTIITQLRGLNAKSRIDAQSGSNRAAVNDERVVRELIKAQKVMASQTNVIEQLRKEVEFFTKSMNTRLEYYRQLQQISDMVAPMAMPPYHNWTLGDATPEQRDIPEFVRNIAKETAALRYLTHLKVQSNNTDDNANRQCVICQETIELGSLTVCGHQFCKECIMEWWHAHRSCPVCKRHLSPVDLHDVTYKPRQLQVAEEVMSSLPNGASKEASAAIYSQIGSSMLSQIQKVPLPGPSFTTKIDAIARHIIWLRESDPGAKSIVFSQFKEFLEILSRAFKSFNIGHSSIDKKGGIEAFKNDPNIECFMLHGKAQSTGLNLINASHVFICEPLINTAIELQAIARVDRIGQQQKTNVYLYIVQDTIEQAIYDISVKRRLEHMQVHGKGKSISAELLEGSIEEANSHELENAPVASLLAKGKGSGEFVDQNDLWGCLFGHAAAAATAAQNGGSGGSVVGAEVEPGLRRELTVHSARERMDNANGGPA